MQGICSVRNAGGIPPARRTIGIHPAGFAAAGHDLKPEREAVDDKAPGLYLHGKPATARFRRPFFALWLLAALVLAGSAKAASFTASLDRDSIMLGEQTTLSLKFDGVQPQNAPGIPDIPGLQFQYVGPSSSFSFINGQTSSSITYNYIVTAQRAGDFTIPAMRANVGGQQFASSPLKLQVSKASAPSAAAVNSGNQVAFMRLVVPQQKVYVGQVLAAQLQVFVRDDVENFANFELTSQPADGMTVGKMVQGQKSRTQIGNHVYTVVPLLVNLTVNQPGSLALGPFTANAVVVLPSPDQGGDPFFNQFFNQGQQKQVNLVSDQVSLQSLPLPAENVPPNFNGAVGDYTLAVSAGPTNVAVGDPITVRVQVAGRGALDLLKLPDQSGWNGFKLFPPTSKVDTSDQLGIEGAKTFEEIVTPQNSDVRALPEISFSYFNPGDGQYHTLTQPPMPLEVRSAGSTPLPMLAASRNSAPENQAPQDILPVEQQLGTVVRSGAPLVAQPAFLAAQSLPLLAFLAALVWRRRTDHLANHPRLRRRRAVAQLIASGMDDLRKYAAENKPDEFFATLFRLLQEQLGERLDCPASSITEDVVEEHSLLRGAPEALRNGLRGLFQLCNQARYAPVRGASELNSVAAQFEKVIGELQDLQT